MKIQGIFKSIVFISTISSVFVFGFGCQKNKTSNLPDASTLTSLRIAYNNAAIYNDSLMTCNHDSSLLQNDSIKWISMIHYYDHMYHNYDSTHTGYNNMCLQQFSANFSSNMMGSGMMGNNYRDYSDCIVNMKKLHQLHVQYHPHF